MERDVVRQTVLRPYIEILSFWGESIEDYLFVFDVKEQQFYFSSCIWEKYPLPFIDISFGIEDWISVIDVRDRNKVEQNLEEIKKGITDQVAMEYRMIDRKGVSVWVNCVGKCVSYDDGKPSIIVGSISENVVSKKIDQLTGLQNQTVLEKSFQEILQKGESGYFLILGIDDFKNVNDKYGRKFGDEQLKKLAEIIDKNLDYDSRLYRLDGDKFGVNLVGYSKESAKVFYDKIKTEFSIQTYSNVSAGAVSYPTDVNNYHNLYQYAEDALNQSKQQGKNKLSFFSIDIYKGHLFFIDLKEEILESIKNDFEGFYIYYQPVVKNENGMLIKAEALMRWRSKQYGEISPVVFIPILEQTGLILEAGKWILEKAMKQCHEWRQYLPNFRMNINLSYIQLKDKRLMETIFYALDKANIPGSAIILEVTESIQLQDYSYFNLLFYQLSKKGIQISIDDFGTGYSSLGYLKELRVDEIKIDRCFVKSIQEGGYNSHLIKNMIELAHSVNIRVCVEGVETVEERTVLKKLSPDVIQGYYFGRPETPDKFYEKFITKAKEGEPIVDDGERKVVSEHNNMLKKNSQNYQNLLDELDYVIYVCDAQTYELYYINKLGKKLTGVFDYTGKKCYEVFRKGKEACAGCKMHTLEQGVFRTKIKKEKNVEFLLKEKKIIWDGKPARLEMITENGEKE
ncbi:GGDEF and EAL domain-containing protein [Lachnospiraceae bacterium 46-61]